MPAKIDTKPPLSAPVEYIPADVNKITEKSPQNLAPVVNNHPNPADAPKQAYIAGVYSGWQLREKVSNIINGVAVLGGAAIGAIVPRNTINSANLLLSGNKDLLIKKGAKISSKTRGKAALIGAAFVTGAAAVTTLAINTVKSAIKSVSPKNNKGKSFVI